MDPYPFPGVVGRLMPAGGAFYRRARAGVLNTDPSGPLRGGADQGCSGSNSSLCGLSAGIDHDTAEFAVESIRRWWREMGAPLYPRATRLLITADCGGSNGHRLRLWKVQLQRLADELRLALRVCHFPPGTSKWNKIEHRMFCHITNNWRGRPLLSRRVVVNLIGRTTTVQGLRIKARLDTHRYAPGIKVSQDQLAAVPLKPDAFHGEWNYAIKPRG